MPTEYRNCGLTCSNLQIHAQLEMLMMNKDLIDRQRIVAVLWRTLSIRCQSVGKRP